MPPIELSDSQRLLVELARRIAADSPDRSRKVGAIMLDNEGKITSFGCNTMPDGIPHEDRFLTRPAKYDWTEHAERRAIFKAAREMTGTVGRTMILPWFPCVQCARAIADCGVKHLISTYPDISDPNWGSEFVTALEILAKKGVRFDRFIDDRPPPRPVAEGEKAEEVSVPWQSHAVEDLVSMWNTTRSLPSLAPSPRRRHPPGP